MHFPRIPSVFLCTTLILAGAALAQFERFAERVDAVTASLVADTSAITPGKPFTAGIHFEIDPGWNIYGRSSGGMALPTTIEWKLPDGFTAGPLQWPAPVSHRDSEGALSYVYLHEALVYSEITPPARLPDGPVSIKAKVSWQMCSKDDCKQGEAALAASIPVGEGAGANTELFVQWRSGAPTFGAAAESAAVMSASDLWLMLGSAFLGGLLLNLMPCVLPVIALKIFGFVNQAGEEPGRVFRLGLAYVGGVFTFFLALAALTVGLKSSGVDLNWGFQFQNPIILGALITLVFVFALNLLGVFEIVLAGGTASRLGALSRRDGYGGAFLHGIFTTLLGTSCTAPFLGAALGFALVAPAPVVFAIFTTIATGMSLPYFLLTAKPAWLRYLPKPGAWMGRLKQFTGFIMLGTVVWLLGVYGGAGEEAARITTFSAFLLLVAVACWIHGLGGRKIISWAAIVALLGSGYFLFLRPGSEDHIPWEPWSESRVADANSKGRTVFVDFTAAWCPNCHAIEKYVLETGDVRAALREKNILPLKADWTKRDPVVGAELKKYGRNSIPTFLLCRPGESRCRLLPMPTQDSLLAEFQQLP